MEKNLKNFITTVINTVDMFEEAKKALLTKADKGYTLKVTGKYNNRTGEFEYV